MMENYSFGRIVIAGTAYTSDLKIINGKVISHWWRKAGHAVEQDDIVDILAAKPHVVIIGQGNPGMMRVTAELKDELGRLGIALIEEPTAKAVATFNRLFDAGKNIAAGFHLTC